MATKTFVSPGVFTSEKDLSFITRQVGVTSLGLVGETTIGPAFQPIFISNYSEFQSFFGGLNATKIKDNGAPQYELSYIAKSFLTQSNQLFVTRILGFTGYDAGLAWGITLDAALDPNTVKVIDCKSYAPLISFSASTVGKIIKITSPQPILQTLIDEGTLDDKFKFLRLASIGMTADIPATYTKNKNGTFDGISFNLYVDQMGVDSVTGYITGTASGDTITYSGTSYSDVEDRLVALLRSRGNLNENNQSTDFEISGTTGIVFDKDVKDSINSPVGDFALSGVSKTQGEFNYLMSLDKTKNNYLPKVLGRNPQDGNTVLFVEELYMSMFDKFNAKGKIRGLKQKTINYSSQFEDYKQEFKPAVTPYVVSELRGSKVLRLFRFQTISDGNAANEQFKITIKNIKPDSKEFDIAIRGYYDKDSDPSILEAFSRCTMDPNSNNYVGKRIGTTNGLYPSKSKYVTIEMDDSSDTSNAFPAGFLGYPIRNYQINNNENVKNPKLTFKRKYDTFENKKKFYLGLSDTVGIDSDFFDYKGIPQGASYNMWTGHTNGFHMDKEATGATIDNVNIVINNNGDTYSPIYEFDTGNFEFKTEAKLTGTDYEKVFARKFSFVPYGGFDGWDSYRTRRSNTDKYIINGKKGQDGLLSAAFSNKTLSNGDVGINSDYYAYLEGIWTFRNPEAVNINVLATPGIDNFDNTNLVEATIEMIQEERKDSLYIMTTPDTDSAGDSMGVQDVTDFMDDMYDSNYSCTYWPWIQINDTENNLYIFVPPTRDVVRNIALTDNIAHPWYAVAGIQRGSVDAVQARKKLTISERDHLYDNRINPIATFTSDGIKIWGNKTLQVTDSALNRINVRRLLLQARKLISAISIRLLFEPNDAVVRNQFLSMVNPILEGIRAQRGLTDFRVEVSSSPEDMDRNQMKGIVKLKPTRSLEYIELEFQLSNTGASFDDI